MELFETIWSTERASLTLERQLFSGTGQKLSDALRLIEEETERNYG